MLCTCLSPSTIDCDLTTHNHVPQCGELEATQLIWWRSKNKTLARVGLNLAATAGHLHVVEYLHLITGNMYTPMVKPILTHNHTVCCDVEHLTAEDKAHPWRMW
jgi:hypothetical protein